MSRRAILPEASRPGAKLPRTARSTIPGFVVSVVVGLALYPVLFPAVAGPLNPPAGTVAPTYKTLTDVEPRIPVSPSTTPGDADSVYKISQPGSYYLTANIAGLAGKHGIEIASSGVTLDLNGFDLTGLGPASGSFDGITVTATQGVAISVRNGSVRNWGDAGVDLGFVTTAGRVSNVTASGNAGIGINGGISCVITDCTASANGALSPPPLGSAAGIRANNGSTVSNCSATSNGGQGILVSNGCTITDCAVYFNAAAGGAAVNLAGISTGSACTVTGCTAFTNQANGIYLGESSTARDCVAQNNTRTGILANANSAVSGCVATFNTNHGIQLGDHATATGCAARSNQDHGFSAGEGCTAEGCTAALNGNHGFMFADAGTAVGCTANDNGEAGLLGETGFRAERCTARSNGTDGIVLGQSAAAIGCASVDNTGCGINTNLGVLVADCTVSYNDADGIRVLGQSEVRGNACFSNRNAGGTSGGISVGFSCRVEANTSTGNDVGIEAVSAVNGRNILLRNTCTSNLTNWEINAGNKLLIVSTPSSAAISGNSGGSGYGSSDPNANFTY